MTKTSGPLDSRPDALSNIEKMTIGDIIDLVREVHRLRRRITEFKNDLARLYEAAEGLEPGSSSGSTSVPIMLAIKRLRRMAEEPERRLSRVRQLTAALRDAQQVVAEAVTLMPKEQLRKWKGWQEILDIDLE